MKNLAALIVLLSLGNAFASNQSPLSENCKKVISSRIQEIDGYLAQGELTPEGAQALIIMHANIACSERWPRANGNSGRRSFCESEAAKIQQAKKIALESDEITEQSRALLLQMQDSAAFALESICGRK